MAGEFQLRVAKSGQYHFNLLGRNGQIILQSEMYDTKAGALNGIKSVMTNAILEERFARFESKSEKPYFIIKAGNHQVIGQSQMYESVQGRDNGIDAVKSAVVDARITDLTVEIYNKLEYNGHKIALNLNLIKKNNLSQKAVDKILELHRIRLDIEDAMKESDDKGELGIYLDQWHQNQFDLQSAWGFERDINYHMFWELPKCTCPKLDNYDAYPTGRYVTTHDCILHGRD
jgi:uncharacterized protein YegP (UPF0339 family)